MTEGDLDAVMAVAGSLKDAPRWSRTAYGDVLGGVDVRRLALVAELDSGLDGQVAGFLVASLVEDRAELESIAVAADRQRVGVATGLLRRLIELLRVEGAAELILEVRDANRAALGLYEGLGFARIGARRGYYRDPDEDAVVMRLAL
jgi:ribosomal-protein-alanine N-acetyltransferase